MIILKSDMFLKKLQDDAIIPEYKTKGAAGMDLYTPAKMEPIHMAPGDIVLVKLGFSIALPLGTEAQVRSRSGLALKQGVVVLNSPGTIDEDYRGECGVILMNAHKQSAYVIEPASRIAQMVIQNVVRVKVVEATDLPETERGSCGFGSTGNV